MAAYYTFEDYSSSTPDAIKTDNPYHDLIAACRNDPPEIQNRYATHRAKRNAQQKENLLSPTFSGVTVDEILAKLENPSTFPDFVDPRHCLVFWARPPRRVRELIQQIQERLSDLLPHLWLMAPDSLHMTALEITHSRTPAEIDALVAQLAPHAAEITNFTLRHRARLVRPTVSFDAQAFALSFLPATAADDDGAERGLEHAYTYHHLRRDLLSLARDSSGVEVASRYVIPSAHLTIARYIQTGDLAGEDGKVDRDKVSRLVERCEEINAWLEREFGGVKGAWTVGEEKGLEFRKGALWYGGGGETVMLGKGF